MRTEKEIQAMIDNLEEAYPEGMAAGANPISNYCIGILAGLKSALGEYPSFAEIDMEDFMESIFNQEKEDGTIEVTTTPLSEAMIKCAEKYIVPEDKEKIQNVGRS